MVVSGWSMRGFQRESTQPCFERSYVLGSLVILIVLGVAVVPFAGLTTAQNTTQNGASTTGSNSSSSQTVIPSTRSPNSGSQTTPPETSPAARLSQQATVMIHNQSTSRSTVTIASINLPNGGYAVVHDSTFLPPKNLTHQSVIGVSEKLSPGIHRNISINLSSVVSGSLKSQLGFQYNSQVVVSAAHDTGVNGEYEFVSSNGQKDRIYGSQNSSLVYDTAYIKKAKQTTNESANENQSSPIMATTSTAAQDPTASAESSGSNPNQERGIVNWLFNNILMVSIGVVIVCSLVVGEIISRQID